ncbi:MAG: GNAT family N-acetyltransferase, partial [Pseudomonadota bacterium]|nr:GNAT family N-acetyltransferase [Pseudomonadota bacterium]
MKARIIISLDEVLARDWDALANPDPAKFNPFISHAFLSALEKSGSAIDETGWAARHVLVEDAGTLVAAAPCYLKSHSQGEYVFDHGWAEAFQRAGGRYYPKLQVCVPFSPVVTPKLLGKASALPQALTALCAAQKASSVHITFTAETDQAALRGDAQWLERHDIQFHWHNHDYKTFDEFLGALSSSKRKNIRKERAALGDLGL